MSLGSGHVWQTESMAQAFPGITDDPTFCRLVCSHCGVTRMGQSAKLKRWYRRGPKRGKNCSLASFRFHGSRPLGTCPEIARRRAAGEAEIRATLDAFE